MRLPDNFQVRGIGNEIQDPQLNSLGTATLEKQQILPQTQSKYGVPKAECQQATQRRLAPAKSRIIFYFLSSIASSWHTHPPRLIPNDLLFTALSHRNNYKVSWTGITVTLRYRTRSKIQGCVQNSSRQALNQRKHVQKHSLFKIRYF